MSEIFKLVAKLTLDTSEFDKNTDESKEKASVFADVLKADLVGKGISLAVDGLKKLGGAAKDFIGDAVDAYGSVEQLRGGIETLFGDSAQKVMADADEAFKSAGMSASEYMETSIQSAASLINSLGGDQAKAADLMNMSITDMADNVNKMGTSMEGVQNAYRGFSRGNFTMLDNLALGFAGTKEGMQELLDKAHEISGVEYDISSYSDMVEAIHVVQTEMGITGTTAKEAAGTIQGSVGAMKSAWENFVAGIADPDANLGQLIENLVDTSSTALDNIVPAVGRTLSSVGVVIGKLAPVAMQKIPEIFNDLAPDLGEAALAMVEYIVDAFTENADGLIETGAELVRSIGEGLVEGIPEFLENVLPMIEGFSETLREGAGQLVDIGIEFILNLAQGIMNSLPTLLEQLPQIVINIAGVINDNAPKLIAGGIKLIQMLISGIINAVPTLIANFPQIFQAILAVWSALNWIDLGKSVITFIKNGVTALQTQIPNTLKDIGKKATEFFKNVDWANAGSQAITFIKNAIMGLFTSIPSALTSIGNAAVSAFKGINWFDLGANIIRGIVNGISSNVGAIVDAAKQAAKNALKAAKDFLGIKSPSRVFRDEVGKMIPLGLAGGIEEDTPLAIEAANKLAEKTLLPFDDMDLPEIGTVETGSTREESSVAAMLSAILIFLQNNWPDDNPVPIVLGGETVGYYDRQLGVRANMRRRGVI